MYICVYVIQGVFSYPPHKTNSQDRQKELCQSMLLSWRSSLCMRIYVHSVTLSCARVIYYPCPPLAKGIFYQRPTKLSEMNHYIPKYRLRSDLRMKNNITSTLWVLNTFDVKQFSSFKALVLTWDSPITLLIHLFRM